MLRRLFSRGRDPEPSPHAGWWRDADRAADAADAQAIEPLRRLMAAPEESPDESENQLEMLDGLNQLIQIAARPALPSVPTRHRVIGTDECHLVAPAALVESPAAGKLFITSARLVFAAGGVTAWPWHRVREVTRSERDLLVVVAGTNESLHIRCNCYADAVIARHLSNRLRAKSA